MCSDIRDLIYHTYTNGTTNKGSRCPHFRKSFDVCRLVFIFLISVQYSISSEFMTLMKKVTKSPLIMDVVNIAGVQKTLDRLADLLGKIQKALGEYLERERASFPRYEYSLLYLLLCD